MSTTGRHLTGSKWPIMLAAIGLAIATPVSMWWLVGDQSTVSAGGDPDYTFRPVELDPAVERLVGIGCTLAVIVTALFLTRASRRHQFDVRWWSVIVPVLVAGVIVGAGWRVMTAAVIGANIGAGLMILYWGPAVVALLVWALGCSVYLVRSANSRSPRAPTQSWVPQMR